MRHADAGYERALEVARERGVRIPMLDRASPMSRGAVSARRGRRTCAGARAAARPADPRHRPAGRGQDHAAAARPRTRCARAGWDARLPRPHGRGVVARAVRAAPPLAGPARRARSARRAAADAAASVGLAAGGKRARGATRVRALFALWAVAATTPAAGRSRCCSTRPPRSARSPTSRACARSTRPFARRAGRAARAGTRARHLVPDARRARLWPALSRRCPLEPVDARPRRRPRRGARRAADADGAGAARRSAGRATCASSSTRVAAAATSAAAWAAEMAPRRPARAACRHTYEALLLRSRGYGMSKAVLARGGARRRG